MPRLISSPITLYQPFSLVLFSTPLFLVLLLVRSPLFDLGMRVPSIVGPSFTHGHETPDRHQPPGLAPFPKPQASFPHIHQIKSIPPALTITIKSLPATITDGKQSITYQLSVNNARSAGPVVAGNTILISNSIPPGLVSIRTKARRADWKVALTTTTSPTQLTAIYVGRYPVDAGVTLSPILVYGVLDSFINPAKSHSKTFQHLSFTAIVKW